MVPAIDSGQESANVNTVNSHGHWGTHHPPSRKLIPSKKMMLEICNSSDARVDILHRHRVMSRAARIIYTLLAMTHMQLTKVRRAHPRFTFASIDDIAIRCGMSPDCVRWILTDRLLIEEGMPSQFSIEESIARTTGYYYPDGITSPGAPEWEWHIPTITSIIEDRLGRMGRMEDPGFSTEITVLHREWQQRKRQT